MIGGECDVCVMIVVLPSSQPHQQQADANVLLYMISISIQQQIISKMSFAIENVDGDQTRKREREQEDPWHEIIIIIREIRQNSLWFAVRAVDSSKSQSHSVGEVKTRKKKYSMNFVSLHFPFLSFVVVVVV